MKRKILLIISAIFIFGQLNSKDISSSDYKNASVSIKYHNRTIYYPGNDSNNPINVHVTIKNNGPETLRFKLADDRTFSMDFKVFTVKNNQLEQTNEVIEKRTTNTTVYFREIALEQGEEYSFVENVRDYIKIPESSVYYLELNYYPELYKSKYLSLKSNRLTLEVRPSPTAAAASVIPVTTNTVEVLQPQSLSPDKVVEQTIISRQKSQWNQFFLYMDLESLLKKNATLKRKYISSSASERERMLATFKADLMQSRIENDIIAVPSEFSIVETRYTPTEGTVTVVEWFQYPNFKEKKNYVYKVRQREGIWQIYDYTVTNLGTE